MIDEQMTRSATRLPPFTSFGPTKTEQTVKPTSYTAVSTYTRILQNMIFFWLLVCFMYVQLFNACELF